MHLSARCLSPLLCLHVVVSSAFAAGATPTPEVSGPMAADAARVAAELFERAFQDEIDRSPEFQTYLGIKQDYGAWDDPSEARAVEDLSRTLAFLAELKRSVDVREIDPDTRLSARLFEQRALHAAAGFRFRNHGYLITQGGGPFSDKPDLLITQHRIDDESDARAYIARLRGIDPLFQAIGDRLRQQAELGIIPPRWVFPQAAEVARNVIAGRPFDDASADSPLWADFQEKLAGVEGLAPGTREALLGEARAALVESVRPAYTRLLTQWNELAEKATDDDGAWKLPDGADYYNQRLARWTTTTLTAEEIHAIGLREVARIHGEIRALMGQTGFAGDLQAFFSYLREDPRFYFPDTPEGREDYLARVTAVVDDMRGRLDALFITKPRADIVVKATEPYREKSAPKAFYQPAAPNGSRPGMYYVTLYNLREMPVYQLEAIAYHEGLPGHHMQIAIAQELKGLPRFRRFEGYGAYSEGWGLYCELLPKEIGLYRDPYSDVGRLAMSLLRAVRLVVDTGIHAKHWTRQQAIDYFAANSPMDPGEIVREVERYIVWPGQATSYMVGMLKILELREIARRELGSAFDIREFHDVILRQGALPLDVLEEQVRAWIERKR